MPHSYLDLKSGQLVKLLCLKWQRNGLIQLSKALIIVMTGDKIMKEIRSECELVGNAEGQKINPELSLSSIDFSNFFFKNLCQT